MSYKYLYGFTNEPSYDFSKVIYFGKQDRAEPELNRIIEHYRDSDANKDALYAAKYIIFSKVDTGIDLSDLEAFFIQSYCPELNTVYNPEYVKTVKLSAAELEIIKPMAESLTWYCIRNSLDEVKYISRIVGDIQNRNKELKNASHVFASKEELLNLSFTEIRGFLSEGSGAIKPEIENSLISPLFIVKTSDSALSIQEFGNGSRYGNANTEVVTYRECIENLNLPELNLQIPEKLIIKSREYAQEQMAETQDWKNTVQDLFNMWRMMINIYCNQLTKLEPDYCKLTRIIDLFDGDQYRYFGEGFNSKNEYLIDHIKNGFVNKNGEVNSSDNFHIYPLFHEIFPMDKIINMTIAEYVSYMENLPEKEKGNIEKTISENNLQEWVKEHKFMAENHEFYYREND